MAIYRHDGPKGRKGVDRTRLTGRLALFSFLPVKGAQKKMKKQSHFIEQNQHPPFSGPGRCAVIFTLSKNKI